jgi:hypothetical protein
MFCLSFVFRYCCWWSRVWFISCFVLLWLVIYVFFSNDKQNMELQR